MAKVHPLGKEILCTLGPVSLNDRTIARLEGHGIGLFRINLSHTKLEDVEPVIHYIQKRSQVPVCLDTEGAQIRTGAFKSGRIELKDNDMVRIVGHAIVGDAKSFNLYPSGIIAQIKPGDLISIDFNSVLVQVIQKESEFLTVRVLTGGLLGQNKAVSVDRDIDLPPLTQKDIKALAIGKRLGIRHVALSFANRAKDVEQLRKAVHPKTFVISKIESLEGVRNLEAIAAKSNALLIDRGDLSRQAPIEQIPRLQKDIICRAKKAGVKIYVATNLLESMINVPTPTRAEVNDIFNTLNDGADGLVLAAETAIGRYPVQCAMMVSKVIEQFNDFNLGRPILQRGSFLLAQPHGGVLVNRMAHEPDLNQIKKCKVLDVDLMALLDAEQIALGVFSPLEGFMNKKDLVSVMKDYRLSNGTIWPLPIMLPTLDAQALKMKKGSTLAMRLKGTPDIYATIKVEEVFKFNLNQMAKGVYGVDSDDHPGVKMLKERGDNFIAGTIELIKRLPSSQKYYELTPLQTRSIFENKGWSRVVGFHTRNVVHRAHEHIQMMAFEQQHCDGIFIHPVVGPKKSGDWQAEMILKSYELAIEKHYPTDKVLLGAFQNYSRYAGPREAVFTALCRKNFGCSHFIIGRDHAGVGNFYAPDASQKLFEHLGDIGIAPVFFNQVHYCAVCRSYVQRCEHHASNHISGTKSRAMLQAMKCPPSWFMRPAVARLMVDAIKQGKEVFVT